MFIEFYNFLLGYSPFRYSFKYFQVFKTYRKPNDKPLYVHTKSSHPPTVLKQVPHGINKRLVNISSTEEEFTEAAPEYQRALKDSGYSHKLVYNKEGPRRTENKKKRQIYWFNPPFSASVTTNIGKKFLALVDKHFPKTNELHKIFNRNTMKVSYSCTKNVKTIIKGHNSKLLQGKKQNINEGKKCNCQISKKHLCPMKKDGCHKFNVIYEAKTNETPPKIYIGSTKDFKKRYGGHKSSFKNKETMQTALSRHVWDQEMGETPNLEWRVVTTAPPYQVGGRSCSLCLTEKLHILRNANNPCFLNKRTEIAQRCRHRAEFRLDKLKR